MTRQPWIGSARFDGVFILAPGILVTAIVLSFPGFFRSHEVSPLVWAVLIVGVDVGHVYSTLYRTYFDFSEFRQRRALYVLAPLLGWLAFAALYSLGAMVFWRVLAYLAVFHFVRQQYGFMMLYGRGERQGRLIDQAAIYAATIFPLVWWHTHARRFSWFVAGDFFSISLPIVSDVALAVYGAVGLAYIGKEFFAWRRGLAFNWPRNLLLGSTAFSWWGSIVALNSDLAFTAVNVIAHGVPYMALIWLYGRNRTRGLVWGQVFSVLWLPVFLGVPLAFAYFEEGLWDGLVWSEHPGLFGVFDWLPVIEDNDLLVWLVPLLALPQITHYILDAFIWRLGSTGTPWRRILLPSAAQP